MVLGNDLGVLNSVLPISMKRPPRGSNRNDASVNSPASELSTTSTPRPSVVSQNVSSNASVRESATCVLSHPIVCNVSHLPRLAVAKTSNPHSRASCTAAIPTARSGVYQHRLARLHLRQHA